ncbi:MAG: hypothetical protein NT137_00135 [Methanomassiliicoccales archaeon]|nr:hypothetical protein [Methanomassiliicoccales archaeon]
MKVYRRLANLRRGFEIVVLNFKSLRDQLASFSNPEVAIPLLDRNHPERMQSFWLFTLRHLNNYLWATRALRYQIQRFSEKETDASLLKVYEEETGRLSESPLWAFVKDLSDFCMHRDIPPIGSVMKFEREGNQTTTDLVLSVEGLLKADSWNAGSKKFLRNAGKEVRLLEMAEEHFKLIGGFFTRFHDKVVKTHMSELTELERLQEEINRLDGRIRMELRDAATGPPINRHPK